MAPAPYGPQVGTWAEPHIVWGAPFSGLICSSGRTGMLGRKLPSPSAPPPTAMDMSREGHCDNTCAAQHTRSHLWEFSLSVEGSVPR